MKPLLVDGAGSGLYELEPGGARAFIDFENPEDRWCRQQGEDDRKWVDEWEREERLWRETCRALEMRDPDDDADLLPVWIELHGRMEEF